MSDISTPRHQRPTKLAKFLFGCPYYPEHWTPAERAEDPKRMAAAGMNVVRMAEFAWDRIEPRREQLDFSLFDQTIAALAAEGIDTILCTPTATPPRWLTIDHPEWMRVDESGRRMGHGTRQHCCTNNLAFRAESRRITQAMAEHYKDNPHVIGWQTDNELHCHFNECFCDACAAGFRQWLAGKYGTIAALNAAWGNAFWALTYDSFDQVPLPYPSSRPAYPNPTHELDYFRFLSDGTIAFQREQVAILRAAAGRWWVTHNGLFRHIDYWKFTEDLDFLGVDIYPGFAGNQPAGALCTALWAETCRAVTGGFIVPEQQGGPGGQKPYIHLNPQPGQMRLWAWQSIANGADGMLHFRWRTCRFGAEEYWCGILDHDNIPRRRYEEFSREGADLKRIGGRILHTVKDVQAGVLIENDQDEACTTLHLGLPRCRDQANVAYGELWKRHMPVGLVHTADAFDGLRLVVLPSMPMMDDGLAGRLRAFVEGGGVLIVTARTAIKDRNNQVIAQTPPGALAELCGATVEEFGRLEEGELTLRMMSTIVPAGQGYEVLKLRGASAAATWQAPADGSPCAATGQPGVAVHHVGKGVAVYVGTYLSEHNVAAVTDLALSYATIRPLAKAAEYVEVTRRTGGGRALTFVLNHYAAPQTVRGLPNGKALLGNQPREGEVELPAWEVAVIEEE
jgi:beta-galactosidase